MIRRIVALSALSIVAFAPAAFAAPHGEEADGCDHGATSKPCRPDPQPDRGKDCDVHGNHGGVNEDHCAGTSTTTTTLTDTTTTTTPVRTGTPVTTSTTEGTPSTSVPSDSSGDDSLTPYLGCVTPEGHPYLTNVEQGGCGAPTGAPEPAPTLVAAPVRSELAATGWGQTLVVFLGLWCLLGGLTALALAQMIRGAK